MHDVGGPAADPAQVPLQQPTVPIPTTYAPPPTAHADHGGRREVRPEDPKRNPVTYVALAIAVLALVLSLVALGRHTGPHQIDVGGRRCIVDRIEGNKADTLFCQT
jgi:hypothetical protein